MLVILAILPVAAPFIAMLNEKTVAQIIVIDLTGEVRFPIQIRLSGDWLHDAHAVNHLRVRVIQRIDIYRQAQPMLGNPGGVGNEAEIEGGIHDQTENRSLDGLLRIWTICLQRPGDTAGILLKENY